MGINKNVARFLLSSADDGVDFSNTLTLGVQDLHTDPASVRRILARYGRNTDAVGISIGSASSRGAAFLAAVGADPVTALDASDYEGADLVHDLNEPFPENLRDSFSVVFDGGTLEHVFDLPRAAARCMTLVRKGGHFIMVSPANNMCGHGFYQLSPDFFFRLFSLENGYQVERLVAATPDGSWYEVVDPATAQSRVEIINDEPTYFMMVARRTACVEPLGQAPQQSDYAALWSASGEDSGLRRRLRGQPRVWQSLRSLKGLVRRFQRRRNASLDRSPNFRRVER